MKKLLLIAVVLFFAYRLVINSTGFCIDEMRVIPDEEICVDWLIKQASSDRDRDLGFEATQKSASEYLKKYPWACDIERSHSLFSAYSHYLTLRTRRYGTQPKDNYYTENWYHIDSCNQKSVVDKYVGFGYTREEAEKNYNNKLKNNLINPR